MQFHSLPAESCIALSALQLTTCPRVLTVMSSGFDNKGSNGDTVLSGEFISANGASCLTAGAAIGWYAGRNTVSLLRQGLTEGFGPTTTTTVCGKYGLGCHQEPVSAVLTHGWWVLLLAAVLVASGTVASEGCSR